MTCTLNFYSVAACAFRIHPFQVRVNDPVGFGNYVPAGFYALGGISLIYSKLAFLSRCSMGIWSACLLTWVPSPRRTCKPEAIARLLMAPVPLTFQQRISSSTQTRQGSFLLSCTYFFNIPPNPCSYLIWKLFLFHNLKLTIQTYDVLFKHLMFVLKKYEVFTAIWHLQLFKDEMHFACGPY